MAKTEHDIFYKPQQHRLFILDRLLRRPGGATREQITAEVRAHRMGGRFVDAGRRAGNAYARATFRRDLDILESDLGATIKQDWRFDEGANRTECFYKYADPTWTMGRVTLREGDLFALLLAKEVVNRYAGLPIAEELQRVYSHLQRELNDTVTIHANQMAPIAFGPDGSAKTKASPKIWKSVLAATTRRLKLQITYQKSWDTAPGDRGGPKVRIMHPYHIVNLCGTWYLIGSASERNPAVRQYQIDRILEATPLKPFTMPADFRIEELLDSTFGRFIGALDDVVDIRLRFRKQVTPLIKGREFQPYQKMVALPDGSIELTLRVSTSGPLPLYHVAGWVMSFGADVKVLEPESLREQVRKAAMAAAAQYAGSTGGN